MTSWSPSLRSEAKAVPREVIFISHATPEDGCRPQCTVRPQPALPGVPGHTNPSATLPTRPAPHGVPVGACTPLTEFPVLPRLPSSMHAGATTPADAARCTCRFSSRATDGLPLIQGGSASALPVSRPAQRSLHVPACMVAELLNATLLSGVLQSMSLPPRTAPAATSRKRQLLGGIRTHQENAPFHGALGSKGCSTRGHLHQPRHPRGQCVHDLARPTVYPLFVLDKWASGTSRQCDAVSEGCDGQSFDTAPHDLVSGREIVLSVLISSEDRDEEDGCAQVLGRVQAEGVCIVLEAARRAGRRLHSPCIRQKLLDHPHCGHVDPRTRCNDGALGCPPSGGRIERFACERCQEFAFGKAGLARRVLAGLQDEAADAAACMVRIGVHGPHAGRFAPRGRQLAIPVRPAMGRDEVQPPQPTATPPSSATK